jgi:hypothetical protein
MLARLASVIVCFLFVTALPSEAEDPSAAAQAVISGQIDALTADDAEKAYFYASPAIRNIYPDKERFLEMVRKSYEPVYKAGNYAFGRFKSIGGGEMVLQEVMITSRQGKDWTAIYELRLVDDGSYKVNGVRMLPTSTSTGI